MAIHGELDYDFSADGDMTTLTITGKCDWADVFPTYDATVLPSYLYQHSEAGDLYCTSITARSSVDALGIIADITVHYSNFKSSRRFEVIPIKNEFQYENTKFKWEDADYLANQQIKVVKPAFKLKLEFFQEITHVDYIENIIACIDSVNSTEFLGCPAETLLFELDSGTEFRWNPQQGTVAGVYASYSFLYDPEGHNKFWREGIQLRDKDGKKLFYHAQEVLYPDEMVGKTENELITMRQTRDPYWNPELEGLPVMAEGIKGQSDFDKLVYSYEVTEGDPPTIVTKTDYWYKGVDYATVLGIDTTGWQPIIEEPDPE